MAIIRPSSDIVTGWTSTGANSYGVIDETTADTADYISASSAGLITRVGLGSTTDPGVDTGHVLRYRADHDNSDGRGVIARVVQTGSFPFIVTSKQPWRSQPRVPVEVDSKELIAHAWVLNVKGARALHDSIGNAHGVFGTGTGGTTGNTWVLGPNGWEVRFDNSGTGTTASTQLLVGNASGSAAPQSTKWTFECWLLYISSAWTQTLFGGSNGGIQIRITTAHKINLLKQATASIGESTTALTSGNRYHLAVTYDGANVIFYVNGVAAGSASSAQTFSHGQYALGWALGVPSEYLNNGNRLGRVVFTNKVLSAAEILHRYNYPWQIFRPITLRTYVDLGRKVIAERTPTLTTSPADYTIDLSEAEAALITDYSALAIEVEST